MGRVLGCVAVMERGGQVWSGRCGTHGIALCDAGCSPGAVGFAHIPLLTAVLSGCERHVGTLHGTLRGRWLRWVTAASARGRPAVRAAASLPERHQVFPSTDIHAHAHFHVQKYCVMAFQCLK